MRQLAALGEEAPGAGARGQADEREDSQGIRLRKQERCGRCTRDLLGDAAPGSESRGSQEQGPAGYPRDALASPGVDKTHTATINSLCGLLAKYGEVFGKGRKAFHEGMKGALERLAERLPASLIEALRDQRNELARLDERMAISSDRC